VYGVFFHPKSSFATVAAAAGESKRSEMFNAGIWLDSNGLPLEQFSVASRSGKCVYYITTKGSGKSEEK
jgi:hypothetical protein